MAKKATAAAKAATELEEVGATIAIRPLTIQRFDLWVIGMAPLITHAWSEKAKREMLTSQQKRVTGGKGVRDPQGDFVNSLYAMGEEGSYGFPVTGLKKAILAPAHKDRGVPRSSVLSSLWLQHEMVRVRPALAGAICDMPLIRIIGAKPEMREDMVKVGLGLSKKATLAYRAQFWPWALRITGKFNSDVMTLDTLCTLIEEAGMTCGIGEWRNERSGIFGAFRLARDAQEVRDWEKFRRGEGPVPTPKNDMQEAA